MKALDPQAPTYLATTLVAVFAPRFVFDPAWPLVGHIAGGVGLAYVLVQCWFMLRVPAGTAKVSELLVSAVLSGVAAFVLWGRTRGIDLDIGPHTPVVLVYALYVAALAGREYLRNSRAAGAEEG